MNSIARLFKEAVDILEERKAPTWLTEHPELKKRKRIEKVFPHLGIQSFRDPVEIDTKFERDSTSIDLINEVRRIIREPRQALLELQSKRVSGDLAIDFDDPTVANINAMIELITQLLRAITLIAASDNLELKMPNDIQAGKHKIRQNESLFKVYGKLAGWLQTLETNIRGAGEDIKLTIPAIDTLPLAKEFHKVNLPSKQYWIVFNTDDQGVWDVCTMSMRGITSCQAWDWGMDHPADRPTEQRALVGSILSKYVGVIYLTSGSSMEHGEKMLKRCVVRLVRHRNTHTPYIVVDRMYDHYDPNIMQLFIDALQRRTSIKVLNLAGAQSALKVQPAVPSQELELQPESVTEQLPHGYRSYQDTMFKKPTT